MYVCMYVCMHACTYVLCMYIESRFCQGVLLFNIFNFTPVKYVDYEYPAWAHLLGILLALSSMLCPPAFFIYSFVKARGSFREVMALVHLDSHIQYPRYMAQLWCFITARTPKMCGNGRQFPFPSSYKKRRQGIDS